MTSGLLTLYIRFCEMHVIRLSTLVETVEQHDVELGRLEISGTIECLVE